MSRSYYRFGLIANGAAALLCGICFVSLLADRTSPRGICMPFALCFLANALLAAQHYSCLNERRG
jgi:hypothetical protein